MAREWDGRFLPGDVVRNIVGTEFTVSRILPGREWSAPYLKVIPVGETAELEFGYPASAAYVQFVRRTA